jgi:hypothetical protein
VNSFQLEKRGVKSALHNLEPEKEFTVDILRLFFDCDEFCRVFEPPLRALLLSDGKRHRHRESTLSASEVMTIVILFQASGFRNFKTYYTQQVCAHLRREFPNLVSYQRMVELQSEIVLPLTALLAHAFWALHRHLLH